MESSKYSDIFCNVWIFSWDTTYTFSDSKNQTKKQMLLSCETAGFFFVLSKNKMLQLEKKNYVYF